MDLPLPDRTSVAIPGNDIVSKVKLELEENRAPSPLSLVITGLLESMAGFRSSYYNMG